jgi:aspartate-semialdehyde dehydrogenase
MNMQVQGEMAYNTIHNAIPVMCFEENGYKEEMKLVRETQKY